MDIEDIIKKIGYKDGIIRGNRMDAIIVSIHLHQKRHKDCKFIQSQKKELFREYNMLS